MPAVRSLKTSLLQAEQALVPQPLLTGLCPSHLDLPYTIILLLVLRARTECIFQSNLVPRKWE